MYEDIIQTAIIITEEYRIKEEILTRENRFLSLGFIDIS